MVAAPALSDLFDGFATALSHRFHAIHLAIPLAPAIGGDETHLLMSANGKAEVSRKS